MDIFNRVVDIYLLFYEIMKSDFKVQVAENGGQMVQFPR